MSISGYCSEQTEEVKIQDVQFEDRMSTRKSNRALKKSLVLNGIKGVVTSGQDIIQLSFQLEKAIKGKLKQ